MTFPICIAQYLQNQNYFYLNLNMVLGRSNLFFLNRCKKIFVIQIILENFLKIYSVKYKLIYPVLR